MHAHVPLAAPVTADQEQSQGQNRDPERVVVPPPPITSLGEPAWEAFYALVYVASAVLVESAHLTLGERVAASLALAAMIPWYTVLGRPVMRLNDERWVQLAATWRGPVYLTGMIVLFAVVQYANPDAWFLAFALSPQCFQMTTPVRRAMVFVIVLNVVAGLLVVLAGRSAQDIGTAIGTTLFAIAFSVVYSRWTVRVIDQSRERATLIAPVVAGRLVTHLRRPQGPEPAPLSARETEVLARAARGMTNAEIGRALFISEATVKTHLLRACTKLGVSGRTAAVAAATERGLLKPPAS